MALSEIMEKACKFPDDLADIEKRGWAWMVPEDQLMYIYRQFNPQSPVVPSPDPTYVIYPTSKAKTASRPTLQIYPTVRASDHSSFAFSMIFGTSEIFNPYLDSHDLSFCQSSPSKPLILVLRPFRPKFKIGNRKSKKTIGILIANGHI